MAAHNTPARGYFVHIARPYRGEEEWAFGETPEIAKQELREVFSDFLRAERECGIEFVPTDEEDWGDWEHHTLSYDEVIEEGRDAYIEYFGTELPLWRAYYEDDVTKRVFNFVDEDPSVAMSKLVTALREEMGGKPYSIGNHSEVDSVGSSFMLEYWG